MRIPAAGTLLHLLRLSVAVTLAVVYFLFQTEPFEDEYRESHPAPAGAAAFSMPAVNWETFDKTNAPEAFTFDPGIRSTPFCVMVSVDPVLRPARTPVHPVRDKSPPPPAL
jgi:hypothetical protein